MKRPMIVALVFVLLTLFTACSADISIEQEEAIKRAKEVFTSNKTNPNNNIGDIALYLPAGTEIESNDETNVVLSHGSNLYILFKNPNEGFDSKVVYESTLKTAKKFRINETFEDEGRFGFILVKDIEEDLFEVTVGIGGTKMTTEAKVANLAHEAEQMMRIINSIVEQ